MKPIVALTVQNRKRFDYANASVSTGIPMPIDYNLKDTAKLFLLDEAGQPVPAQFMPLAWWPEEGKIKWVLIHFLADVEANKARTYTLLMQEELDRDGGVHLESIASMQPSGLSVDTGVLRLAIDRGSRSLLSDMSVRIEEKWIPV